MRQMIQELQAEEKNIILFIDELHSIVGAGGAEGAVNASSMLKPALARGELQVVGATTLDEYRKHVEKDPALERRFQPVLVSEPTVDETVAILFGLRDRYEAHHRVKISDEAIVGAAQLSDRYITDRYLPDKAIDLLDEAAAEVRLRSTVPPVDVKRIEEELAALEREKEDAVRAEDYEKAASLKQREEELRAELEQHHEGWAGQRETNAPEVTREDIARILEEWTGVPATNIVQEEAERLLNLEAVLHERVVGQDRRRNRRRRSDKTRQGRYKGPEAPRRQLPVPRPYGRRQDRARPDSRRVPLRRRGRPDPDRHVRVPGEAHRLSPGRRPSRLRRLRGGGPAHRGRATPAIQRGPLRRDREGPPRRLQHPAPDPRRRAPHGRPGPDCQLREHGHHHDFERRQPAPCLRAAVRLHRQGRRGLPGDRAARERGPRAHLQARVP